MNRLLIDPKNWVNQGGILIPITSLPQTKAGDLGREVLVYQTFKEIYPKEKNSTDLIKQGYGKFWANDIIQVLAKLNYIIGHTSYRGGLKEELKIVAPFLEDYPLSIILHQTEPRKLLTRQQLLANIRLAILYSSEKEEGFRVLGKEKVFGKLIYRITNYLEELEQLDSNDYSTWEGKRNLYISMAKNWIFNESSTFALSLSRYWYIFNKIALSKINRPTKLNSLFFKATGTSFNYLTAVGFAIWGFYSEPEKEKRLSEPHEFIFNSRYFRKTSPYARNRLKTALGLFSDKLPNYKSEFLKQTATGGEHFALNPFWRKPIITFEEDAYYLLDRKYFENRFSYGAFWFIYDKAQSDAERSFIKGKWGTVIESYVNELVDNTFPESPKRVFSELRKEINGVDLIIYYPDTLFFIEITTKQVPYNVWTGGNDVAIENAIKKILIKDRNSKGKANQLLEAINKVKKGQMFLPGVDLSKIKKFIPIVLFEKSLPMHNRLWGFYDHIMQNNGITDKNFLAELEFWDLEEMEMILGDILKGRSLIDIIIDKEKANYYKSSVRNYYTIFRRSFDKHPVIEKAFALMSEQAKSILFKR